jgi:hypothetical protein
MKTDKIPADQPIPYLVNDLPVPYRIRMDTPSHALRAFVVPELNVQTFFPSEPESGIRMKVA